MIARLRGTIWEKSTDRLVVDAGGVGYEVHVSLGTAAAVGEEGEPVELYTWHHVREDAHQLFGFSRPDERTLFLLLIGVSGIGPKTALTALSTLTPSDFVSAVASNDVVRLTRLPGVGKKTAERILVELRDKIDRLQVMAGPAAVSSSGGSVRSDTLAALLALGYGRPMADRALQNMSFDGLTVQEAIKVALQKLSGK